MLTRMFTVCRFVHVKILFINDGSFSSIDDSITEINILSCLRESTFIIRVRFTQGIRVIYLQIQFPRIQGYTGLRDDLRSLV